MANRKTIAVAVLAALMMVLPVLSFDISADDTPTLSASNISGYKGEMVDVRFTVSGTELSTARIAVSYDANVLTLVSVNKSSLGIIVSDEYSNGFTAVWMNVDDATGVLDGATIMIATFLIKEDTSASSAQLSIQVDQTFYGESGEVMLAVTGGLISIIGDASSAPRASVSGGKIMQNETITVSVRITNATLCSFKITLSYNSDILEVIDGTIQKSETLPAVIFDHTDVDGVISAVWLNEDDVIMGGEVFSVTFRVISDSKITVSVPLTVQSDYDNTIDSNGTSVSLTLSNGTMIVLGDGILPSIPSGNEIIADLGVKNVVEYTVDQTGGAPMVISKEVFDSLTEGKTLRVNIMEGENTVATWTFKGTADGSSSGTDIRDVNLNHTRSTVPSTAMKNALDRMSYDEDACFLVFDMTGTPPYPAELKVYVGDIFSSGTEVSLYYLDSETLVSEEQKVIVGDDGCVTFVMKHFSEFAILDASALSGPSSDFDMTIVIIAVAIIAVLVLVGFVFMTRKKSMA